MSSELTIWEWAESVFECSTLRDGCSPVDYVAEEFDAATEGFDNCLADKDYDTAQEFLDDAIEAAGILAFAGYFDEQD